VSTCQANVTCAWTWAALVGRYSSAVICRSLCIGGRRSLFVGGRQGDNYECAVIWLVTANQMLNAAATFNLGGQHRARWASNWALALLLTFFYALLASVTLVPSRLSCLFRINCDAANNVWGGALHPQLDLVNNWEATTVMPVHFRWLLLLAMGANTAACFLWQRLAVEGPLADWCRRKYPQRLPMRL
jgi:hypothetical protein